MLRHDAMEGNPLEAVRAGSLALLCFSLLSVLAAILLPYLARLRHIRIGWIWSSSSLIFAALMFSTLIVSDQVAATVIVSLTGLCWAVSMWVPVRYRFFFNFIYLIYSCHYWVNMSHLLADQ